MCWHWRRTWGKSVLFGMGCFILMLAPVLGFLNIYFMRYSLVADHWQYFAIIGPMALVAAVFTKPAPAILVLLVLGGLTWRQSGIYANEETIWSKTTEQNPTCWLGYNNVGVIEVERGEVDKGIAQYRKALALNPDYEVAHYNMGVALIAKGAKNQAMAEFKRALEIKPDYAEARNDLGMTFFVKGDRVNAIEQYRKALEADRNFAEARNNLGAALFAQGHVDEAIAQYRQAVAVNPNYAYAYANLGQACFQKGEIKEAMTTTRRALELAVAQKNDDLIGKLEKEIKPYATDAPRRDSSP
jgi:Flp pilus assembly protein TadD